MLFSGFIVPCFLKKDKSFAVKDHQGPTFVCFSQDSKEMIVPCFLKKDKSATEPKPQCGGPVGGTIRS